MRKIEHHTVPGNPLNEALVVGALDDRGQGNANHVYAIFADETKAQQPKGVTVYQTVSFQNGPIKEAGVNGISNEALLAIVQDRLEGFQSGPFACETNAQALDHVKSALSALHSRTADRVRRGVEGLNKA